MCTINKDDLDQKIIEETKVELSKDSRCKKCNAENVKILLRGKDTYCDTCFLAAATHKFRATLGKSKIVRPNDSVLIAHSGHGGSTALLHLIGRGLSDAANKRLLFKNTVLHVDDGIIKNRSVEERTARIQKISTQVKNLGFDGFVVNLSEVFNEEDIILHPLNSEFQFLENFDETERTLQLRESLNSIKDMTSKEDFQSKILTKILARASQKLKCTKIFLGSTSSSLAMKTLENFSLGRAAQLQNDVGFLDSRFQDILILRPMKDFSKTEITYYLNHFNLEIPFSRQVPGKIDSIRKMTEKFVSNLENEFPGTVSTIFRISEKLSGTSHSQDACAFCAGGIDTNNRVNEVSAIQATEFSHEISNAGNLETKNCEKTQNGGDGLEMKDVSLGLCYGCRLIFRGVQDLGCVPEFTKKNVLERMAAEKIRTDIEEYLL